MSESTNRLRLAMIQMEVTENKRKNISTAQEMLRQATEKGAQMAVLPEMFCCPYNTKSFPVYGEPEGGPCWQAMSEAARENKLYLVAGSMPEFEEGRCYNTSYIFGPDGQQIGKHRKMHLFDIDIEGGQHFQESDTLSAGDQATVFDTAFGKIGVAICYDFRFPELARLMVLDGARILIVPAAFNMTTGPRHWQLMFRSRAVDNQAFTIGVAPARNPRASYVSYAHSIAVSPWGHVIKQMGIDPGIEIVELDLREVIEIRVQLPLLKHRRTDLYHLKCKANVRGKTKKE